MPRWGKLEDRFWPRLVKATNGCLEWNGPFATTGYGKLGSFKNAHRVAYELRNGPIPSGLFVCHRCDNRKCCNPEHLFLATNQQNILDRDAKGRNAHGERHGMAKLSRRDVAEIRRSKLTQTALATKFGVSQPHVSRIKLGKSW